MHVREIRRLAGHESTEDHHSSLEYYNQAGPSASTEQHSSAESEQLPLGAFVADGLQSLLESLAAPAGYDHDAGDYTEPSLPASPPKLVDWGLSENTELDSSPEAQAVAQIAQRLSEYLFADPSSDVDEASDEEGEERSEDGHDADELQEPIFRVKTCTLDVLMHLPRSVFSHRQLELFIWLLKVNNVDDVPSVKSMQELNSMLQKLCGIESIAYNGALGHKYYVNSLAQIIAQEMSNPKDSGKVLEEARQGKRWLEEIPPEKTTPMPVMLRDGAFRMPFRWFVRGKILFAKCWDMEVINGDDGRYWRVSQRESEVSQHDLMKNLPDLRNDFHLYDAPDPSKIKGIQWCRTHAFPIWLYCDDTSGNLSKKWNEHNSFLFTPAGLSREQAAKEFNIHFLCTSNIAPPLEMLDGILDQLEQAEEDGIWAWDCELNELVLLIPAVLALLGDNPMQSEFACHIGLRGKYFCRACWVKGKSSGKPGNSPTGTPASTQPSTTADADLTTPLGSEAIQPVETRPETPAGSEAGSDAASNTSEKKSRGKRVKESLDQIMTRAKAFVKIGKLRTKVETTTKLRSYFDEASKLNTKTKVQKMRTASGVKDTFQLVFLEKLFESYKGKRGKKAKQAALDAKVQSLPKNTTSPVWRIQGLDPHQDTPVEILHVILLGFVKYMWRDLVQNQLKTKADKKILLETRLNSFDVSGLGISPLAGHTLVQYSGSLTGRDFRAIAQAAPFVVYDLVSPDCLATWVALSKLIPLIWQPQIKDVDVHIALLTTEINNFLACAARWTTRWFNKPKFHILLHLPDHIRRFGPAILFATEAFESFNAIIRAKSVHSNRHAPSRDIARAFAQGNRIRHLLSSGLFMQGISCALVEPMDTLKVPVTAAVEGGQEPTGDGSAVKETKKQLQQLSKDKHDWKSAGHGPLSLVASPNTVTQYLGLDRKKIGARGICVSDKRDSRQFSATLTGQKLPQSLAGGHAAHTAAIVHTGAAEDLVLNTAQMRDGVDLQPFRVNSEVLDSDAIDTIIMASVLWEFELKKATEALTDGAAVTEVLAEGSLAGPTVEISS
ncbi:hypothetical protein B0H13DRAFT_2241737 [Mycena leptocephala]|nr:hypothetical protein B0H13DRAFT_2241737 [Mycena leptocephala]